MTRILLLVKGLGRGGAERLAASAALSGEARAFAYEVAYLVPGKDALVSEIEEGGIRVHRLGDRPSWVPRLRTLTRERGIDLVHVHSPLPASIARVALPRHPRIVYTEHNVWARYRLATRWANAMTYHRNDHVFAVSDEVRASIQRSRLGRRCSNVETLHHGLDPDFAVRWSRADGIREELGLEAGVPVVATVANFKPFKGQEHLLRAAALVRRRVPDVRFVLAGVGPRESEMKGLADELDLDGSVLFAGFRADAPRLMTSADVFVLPSEHEGLPIALLEAMALGRPAVATRVGGTPEVIRDGTDGMLVPPRDPQALASAIVSLLDDSGLRGRLGSAARIRAANFDIRKAVRRMEQVYEELLA